MTLLEKARASKLPFAELLKIEFIEAEADRVLARMIVRDEFCTVGQSVHGGALMALADTVGGVATFINLPEGAKGTTTVESKTNFVGAAPTGAMLVATCSPIHKGRRTQVWTTRIETAEGRLVAVVTQTQLVL